MFVALILLACSTPAPEQAAVAPAVRQDPEPAAPQGHAEREAHAATVADLLRKGDLDAVVAEIHIDPQACDEKKKLETEGLKGSLVAISEHLGGLMMATPTDKRIMTYDLSLSSMSQGWWDERYNVSASRETTFEAEFIKGESGVVRLLHVPSEGGWLLRGIAQGLLPTHESRAIAIRASHAMFEAHGETVDAEMAAMLEASFPPPERLPR